MVRRTFTEHDAGYLKLLASRLIASAPQTCVLLAAAQEEPARVVVGASADLKIDCGSLLREALAAYGLRGGGSATMAQGQIPSRPFGCALYRPRRPFQPGLRHRGTSKES